MSGLFGGGKAAPLPEPKPPAPMPDPEDPAIMEKKRLTTIAALQRRGRDSTIMTAPSSRASGVGDDYSRKTTGGF